MSISHKRGPKVPRFEFGTKDSNQKPRWHTCRCVRPIRELGAYLGWHRCRGCGHLIHEWGTAQLPLDPPERRPYTLVEGSAA